jgi:hypothetical protein
MIKTEMKGDTSRWGHREEVKRMADKQRRVNDRIAVTGERVAPRAGRRGKKQWCRGKRGVAHQLIVVSDAEINRTDWWPAPGAMTLCCKVCGRDVDHYMPNHPRHIGPPQKIPTWVTEGPEAFRGSWC